MPTPQQMPPLSGYIMYAPNPPLLSVSYTHLDVYKRQASAGSLTVRMDLFINVSCCRENLQEQTKHLGSIWRLNYIMIPNE